MATSTAARCCLIAAVVCSAAAAFVPRTARSAFPTHGASWALDDRVPRASTQRCTIAPHLRMSSSSSSSATNSETTRRIGDEQLDFTMGYLNKHHQDLLRSFVADFSELGQVSKKKNAWSGDSFQILGAKLVDIDLASMKLEVSVQERGKGERQETVRVALDAMPISTASKRSASAALAPVPPDYLSDLQPVDAMIRKLNRLCWIVGKPKVTGKLIQLGIQLSDAKIGEIKDNLYLNQVPHNRFVRHYFYDMAADAAMEAVVLCSQGKISNRMKMVSMFPEMNPSMDSYRIGTMLEMVRAIAMRLVEESLRVRVCVQGSMGVGIFTGLPKQLNGVSKLLQLMDWQSGEGECNEGMVGTYLNFGGVGKEHVVDKHTNADGETVEQDDIFIIIAPQSMVGVDSSIIGPLQEMVDAAGDRPVILINPDLTDKVSSQGQQSVRGRQQRIDFAESFRTVFHFQNIYVTGTSYFPILGSMTKMSPTAQWIAHQRRDLVDNQGEVYVPVLAGEDMPNGEDILAAFDR